MTTTLIQMNVVWYFLFSLTDSQSVSMDNSTITVSQHGARPE